MTCKELVELVTNYFEGALSSNERLLFEQHLAECEGCSNYVQQMRITLNLLGELPEKSLNPQARNTLLAAFRDWENS